MNADRRRALRAARRADRYARRAILVIARAGAPTPTPWQVAYLAQILADYGQHRRGTIRERRAVRTLTSIRKHTRR